MRGPESGPVVALTGAGISAESGVPTFRGEDGLWRQQRAEQLATPEAFRRNPQLLWEWYNWRRELIDKCAPNAAHRTLASMERSLTECTIITQNVDGLHRAAGSVSILEIHGNIWRVRCTACRYQANDHRVPLPYLPPHCPECGGLLRPDVVWFGESLPGDVIDAAWAAASRCRTMLVIGTSAVVQPAASLPLVAVRNGAQLIEINPAETPLSRLAHRVIRRPAAEAVPEWWATHQTP